MFSSDDAMHTITRLSNILVKNSVSLCNNDGFVVASNVKNKTGCFIPNAFRVVNERRDSLMLTTVEPTGETRIELLLPILKNSDTLGVLCLKGQANELIKYGGVLKRLVEHLLHERDIEEEKRAEEALRRRFMEQWFTQPEIVESKKFIKLGVSLGIDITIPRRMLVVDVSVALKKKGFYEEGLVTAKIDEKISEFVARETKGYCVRINTGLVCYVPLLTDEMLVNFSQKLYKYVQNSYGFEVYIGIDELSDTPYHALIKAEKALTCSKRNGKGEIVFYSTISFDIFIHDIPMGIKKEFISKIFNDCSTSEIEEISIFVKTYFEHNRSIRAMSDVLHMHKNTVQYKIKKICQLTGYDIRDLKHASIIYMASLMQ